MIWYLRYHLSDLAYIHILLYYHHNNIIIYSYSRKKERTMHFVHGRARGGGGGDPVLVDGERGIRVEGEERGRR